MPESDNHGSEMVPLYLVGLERCYLSQAPETAAGVRYRLQTVELNRTLRENGRKVTIEMARRLLHDNVGLHVTKVVQKYCRVKQISLSSFVRYCFLKFPFASICTVGVFRRVLTKVSQYGLWMNQLKRTGILASRYPFITRKMEGDGINTGNERTAETGGKLYNVIKTSFPSKTEIPREVKAEVVRRVVKPCKSRSTNERQRSKMNNTELKIKLDRMESEMKYIETN